MALTDEQLAELEKLALTPHRGVSIPTLQLRALVRELRELRELLATEMPVQDKHLLPTIEPDGWVNISGCGCWRPEAAVALGVALIRAGMPKGAT